MNLDELKARLRISDTTQDEFLKVALDDAIDFVQRTCNRDFLIDGELKLPPAAKSIAALYVSYEMVANPGIKSESIAGMSQTFESGEERDSALLAQLTSAGLRRIRFKSFGG
ncbi:phage head-tail connector protein [Cytobacillus firmus]|uniref:Phage gp6-like head-tail connector protein n=1 Tax=Cytobacillus firmus DS1 TaxID=1307436 RepID=W7LC36_CYTFI|nr:phage head-tail connector protein [Cytobacillus firmus]EWG12741.1 hypothetical protein PBF_04360 [Cytobacillus firmus DS1]